MKRGSRLFVTFYANCLSPHGHSQVCACEQELCNALQAQQETGNAQSSPGGPEKDNIDAPT